MYIAHCHSEVALNKQHKTALNMAKFIRGQSLLLLEKLNELNLDNEADLCEKLHDDAEKLFLVMDDTFGCEDDEK